MKLITLLFIPLVLGCAFLSVADSDTKVGQTKPKLAGAIASKLPIKLAYGAGRAEGVGVFQRLKNLITRPKSNARTTSKGQDNKNGRNKNNEKNNNRKPKNDRNKNNNKNNNRNNNNKNSNRNNNNKNNNNARG